MTVDEQTAMKGTGTATPGAPAGTGGSLPIRDGRTIAAWLGLALVLIAQTVFLFSRFSPAIAAPDANGYWAQGARLFATGRTWFTPESDPQYIGMHWLVTPEGRYYSRYPPGLALLIGAVHSTFGYKASVLINPVLSILAVVGIFLLSRCVVGPGWALVSSAALAANPVFLQHALVCDSHMAVLCLLVWGTYFLFLWGSAGSIWQAFGAGLLLGSIPTVRYPEALYALGIGAFLLLHAKSRPRVLWHYAAAVAGALVPLIPLMIRNQIAFGAFWRTAYSLTNEQTGFGFDYFRQHFANYIKQLHSEGLGLFFPLGILGMAGLCGVRKHRAKGWLTVLVVVPATLLYMAYYWAPQSRASMTMRFVLPTFVCYVVAGTWFLAHTMRSFPVSVRVAAVGALLLCQFIWGGIGAAADTKRSQFARKGLAVITDALEKYTGRGDVILAHSQIHQHLDFVHKWRLVDPTMLQGRPGGRRFTGRAGDDDTPAPMQREKQAIQAEKYSDLHPFTRERAIAWDVLEWAGDGAVYFVGTEDELQRMPGFYFGNRNFEIVARIPLPEAPAPERREGMRGAGMMRGRAGPGGGPDGPAEPFGAPGARPPDVQGMPGQVGRFQRGMPGGMAGGRIGGLRGRGFGGGRGGRPGGGMMGRMSFLADAGEVVIARWTWDGLSEG